MDYKKLSKIADAENIEPAEPDWVVEFRKASEGMPYSVEDYEEDEDGGFVGVRISGYYDGEPSDYENEWAKKAAEADSKEEYLNEDRWNPSWDVAYDALLSVCESMGLEGYDEEMYACPECDYFYIRPNLSLEKANHLNEG